MNSQAFKWIAIAGFVIGGFALAVAVLVGPDIFPLSVEPRRNDLYASQPFTLVDQNGRVVTEKTFRSKPTVWFFGYTNCPDVCPTTLTDLSHALDSLGPAADHLNIAFVTVDPERDTPPVLKKYLSVFDGRVIGLTGAEDEIAAMTKGFFIHRSEVPTNAGTYTVDHSSKLLLVDADGRSVGTLKRQEPLEVRVQKLRALARGGDVADAAAAE